MGGVRASVEKRPPGGQVCSPHWSVPDAKDLPIVFFHRGKVGKQALGMQALHLGGDAKPTLLPSNTLAGNIVTIWITAKSVEGAALRAFTVCVRKSKSFRKPKPKQARAST